MEKVVHLSCSYKKLLADQITPVSLYLNLRDKYPGAVMLESTDYHGQENSLSYLAFDPIASFVVEGNKFEMRLQTEVVKSGKVMNGDLPNLITDFTSLFEVEIPHLPFAAGGFFGHWNYETAALVEELDLREKSSYQHNIQLPTICCQVFRYVIVFRHFHEELYLIEYLMPGETSALDQLESELGQSQVISRFSFSHIGQEASDQDDSTYMEAVKQGIRHCLRGDVFQVVLSRSFSQGFIGDDFNVYRGLRSVNPSPYLFYFDYGSYRIFGSSPEAQLRVHNGKTEIHPIAGTFKRTGDDQADKLEAERLVNDPKENAEHVMLVDLARNDLSRYCSEVKVERYREVQYYSHVIHLVSLVTGHLVKGAKSAEIACATFPAGTLSGAPKPEAMKIIDKLEPTSRGFYGGAIGLIDWNGNFNHAIIIRSFFSCNNTLYYRAGAGVVAKSDPVSELQEVHNKLGALRKAMALAETI